MCCQEPDSINKSLARHGQTLQHGKIAPAAACHHFARSIAHNVLHSCCRTTMLLPHSCLMPQQLPRATLSGRVSRQEHFHRAAIALRCGVLWYAVSPERQQWLICCHNLPLLDHHLIYIAIT